MANRTHVPVLFKEVIAGLQPVAGGKYIDGTVGSGGHAEGILKASVPTGLLLGLDKDLDSLMHIAIESLEVLSEKLMFIAPYKAKDTASLVVCRRDNKLV